METREDGKERNFFKYCFKKNLLNFWAMLKITYPQIKYLIKILPCTFYSCVCCFFNFLTWKIILICYAFFSFFVHEDI